MSRSFNMRFCFLLITGMLLLFFNETASGKRRLSQRRAGRLILRYIRDSIDADNTYDFVLERKWTVKIKEGWVFFYNPKCYVRTRDVRYLIPGHVPLIFNKYTGQIATTGAAHSLQYYIENYHHLALLQAH